MRRVWLEFRTDQPDTATVSLPWKVSIDVDLSDAIGREIFKQRVFDIAVSEVAWRLLRSGDKAADVGANIGYLTSLFSMRVGPQGVVHAFEPHPEVHQKLLRNISLVNLNPHSSPIVAHACALGDVSRNAQLIETDYFEINRGTARIAETNSEGEVRSHSISMQTLDELFPTESLDLLKIDVEGFEARVLQGAARLLQEKRTRHIIYEDHEMARGDLAPMLRREGYSIFSIGYNLLGPRLRPLDRQVAVDYSWESPNFLATLEPAAAEAMMRRRAWQIFRPS